MYQHDKRIVLTLDAGGTNFVFSAIQGCKELVVPIRLAAVTDDTEACLHVLVEGFSQVMQQFLSWMKAGQMPERERRNLLVKYYTLTEAWKMSR